MKRYVRNHLFAEPSFIEGMGRVLDLGATLQVYNYSNSTEAADIKALSNDWLTVGDDIRNAIQQYDREAKLTA